MSLFRLDASIRLEGSHTRQIADIAQAEWQGEHRDEPVMRRDVGAQPIPATAFAAAANSRAVPAHERSPEQRDAVALAATLADELGDADAFIFAVPLYNFGVSQHFKAWVDLVITDPRMGPGAEPATAGKPAILVVARGGSYKPGTPREGWDHAIGWMRRILADVWKMDLDVIECELTLAGVTPALAQFVDLAAESRVKAEELARRYGRGLAAVA